VSAWPWWLGELAAVAFGIWFLMRRMRARRTSMERADHLRRVTSALWQPDDPRNALATVLDEAIDGSHGDGGLIALIADDGERLEVTATAPTPVTGGGATHALSLDPETLVGRTAAGGEPVFAERRAAATVIAAADARLTGLTSVGAAAAVPLAAAGKVIGVLAIFLRDERRFTESERTFLVAISGLCAQAIDRARLAESERAARHDAVAAEESREAIVAAISHELRTPLNAILGWSQMLRTGRLEPEAATRALEAIERNARAQAALLKDLLDMSRMMSGTLQLQPQPVDLSECLDLALDTVRPAAEARQITLSVRRDEPRYAVHGDAARLQQVLWNLLVNAVRFTPVGGRVDVALSADDREATVRVTDTGVGIGVDRMPHIFERFYQGETSGANGPENVGLGLAIVRHLVEAHGGSVSASSPGLNQGSTFVVTLPLSEVPAVAAEGCDP
jgi:signal transduction histidine kinase